MTRSLACILLLLHAGLAGATVPEGPAPGRAEFEAGVRHYRAGDHAHALDAFLAARDRGFESPNLHLNLGLTYYRLARYPDARMAFQELGGFPDYRAIADFHLGLVAARMGESGRAAELWRGVERSAPTPALRERARIALHQLGPEWAPRAAAVYLLAATGYDSNPRLADGVEVGSNDGSSSRELLGYFEFPLAQHGSHTTVLRGGGNLFRYPDASGVDQHGWFAGIGRERGVSGRQRAWSAEFASRYLDGEHFITTYGIRAETAPVPGNSGLSFQGQFEGIETEQAYGYLQGWSLRGGVEARGESGPMRLHAGYQIEFNDREDLADGGEYFSHSPMRHRVAVSVSHPASTRWSLQWDLRYRHSEARDPDRFMDGATLREERRVEDLAQIGIQGRRPLGRRASVLLEYQFSRNLSNRKALDYRRHVFLVGLEWTPGFE